MRWLVVVSAALTLQGCCKKCLPPLPPPPPVVIKVHEPCMLEAPPKMEPMKLVEPLAICMPDGGNGPQLVGCLDTKAAIALERNVKGMQRWIKEAWARCGVVTP